MDGVVELYFKRPYMLAVCLLRSTIKIMNQKHDVICQFKLWQGQEKTVQLSRQTYVVSISSSVVLGRPVVNTVVIYGDRFDYIEVLFKPARFNFLFSFIPGMPFAAPLFEYDINVRNYNSTSKKGNSIK